MKRLLLGWINQSAKNQRLKATKFTKVHWSFCTLMWCIHAWNWLDLESSPSCSLFIESWDNSWPVTSEGMISTKGLVDDFLFNRYSNSVFKSTDLHIALWTSCPSSGTCPSDFPSVQNRLRFGLPKHFVLSDCIYSYFHVNVFFVGGYIEELVQVQDSVTLCIQTNIHQILSLRSTWHCEPPNMRTESHISHKKKTSS